MGRNKSRNRGIILVVAIAIILGGGMVLTGQIDNNDGGGTALPQDINDYATIQLFSRNGLTVVPVAENGLIVTSQYDTVLQDTQLFVRIDFAGSVTAGEPFYGVLHTGIISVETAHGFNEGNSQVWFMIFDLGSCLMGEHSYQISFNGFFQMDIPMVGESKPFRIDNQFESETEPPQITKEPMDFQLTGSDTKALSWTITYLADYTVVLKVNGVQVDSQAFSGSPAPQNYAYTFGSDYDGEHSFVLYINSVEYSSGNGADLPPPIDWNLIIMASFGIVLVIVIITAVRRK